MMLGHILQHLYHHLEKLLFQGLIDTAINHLLIIDGEQLINLDLCVVVINPETSKGFSNATETLTWCDTSQRKRCILYLVLESSIDHESSPRSKLDTLHQALAQCMPIV